MSDNIIIRPQKQFKKITYQVEWFEVQNGKKVRRRKNFKNKQLAENKRNELRLLQERAIAKDALRSQGIVFDDPSKKFDPKFIQEAIGEFYSNLEVTVFDKRHLKREKGILNNFGEFIIDEQRRDYVHEISLLDLESYRKKMLSRNLANATVERDFNTIRSMLNYCVSHKYCEENPAKHLKRLHVPVPKIQTWYEHYEDIEQELPLWASEFQIALEDTMGRPIELCRAKIGDINWNDRTLKLISGKGNITSERQVPLTDRAYRILSIVIARRSNEGLGGMDDLIFRNSKGNPVKTEIFDKAVRKARRSLNLPEHIKPYALRHGGLTRLKRLNVAMADIGALAGHKKTQTTNRYTQSDARDLRNVINISDAAKRKQA